MGKQRGAQPGNTKTRDMVMRKEGALVAPLVPTEVAWAAGFFDGEGYVAAESNGRSHVPALSLKVAQVDRQTLDRFRSAVGGIGAVRGPYFGNREGTAGYSPNRRPVFMYRVRTFEGVQAVLAVLWRFLSPVKRAQFRAAVLKKRGDSHR